MKDHPQAVLASGPSRARSLAKYVNGVVVVAVMLCFAKIAEGQTATSSAASLPAAPLSADDTVSYINATLHKYPTLEFVDSGCPGYEQVVAISSDRRSIIITENSGSSTKGRCDNLQTLTAPIFSLNRDGLGGWSKQGQHSSFFLDCIQRVDCFSRQSEGQSPASAENDWHLHLTAPDEVSNRLTSAIKHLLETLLNEAAARIDPNDPFPKRAQ